MTGNRSRLLSRAGAAAACAGFALTLASCASGPAHGGSSSGNTSTLPPDTQLREAGARVLSQIAAYRVTTSHCATKPSPVVCVEAADRTLGGQVHTYANLLAVGHGFSAPTADVTAARNSAQTLANSLEILGDAQPTQANYNKVLNTFNLPSALDQLQHAVTSLSAQL